MLILDFGEEAEELFLLGVRDGVPQFRVEFGALGLKVNGCPDGGQVIRVSPIRCFVNLLNKPNEDILDDGILKIKSKVVGVIII